jgi:hypothetical protein
MRGVLLLVPYFNRHGWYWGGGFSGDSVDSMHFELSDETIRRVPDTPLFTAQTADAAAGAAFRDASASVPGSAEKQEQDDA